MIRLIAVLVSLLLGAGAAQAINLDIGKLIDAGKNVKDLKQVDEKGEAEIGSTAAASLLGAIPLVKDEKLQAYVNQVGLWLALQTERPDLPWRFGVMDNDSVNAFAAPGGYVFITRGLLLRMRSEAELAGVLAHEISHVLKRHHLQAIQKNAQVGLVGNLMNLTSNESGLAGETKKKMISVSSELYARGLDKNDEFEADRMGVVIATRAGYDPYGLPAMLQTLDPMNPQDSELALMFKTHPAPQKRLELLDGLMTGSMDRYASQPVVADRFLKTVGDYAHH
ncbi:MAG: peptidase M48 [Methylophilales bacterium RIFCSPHIGHO2_02_FULL_57_10]|nr:MAG: peptidase M48 [Methylophilales bacterium RIFCSPHIGHO2_02_FULL_57_10]